MVQNPPHLCAWVACRAWRGPQALAGWPVAQGELAVKVLGSVLVLNEKLVFFSVVQVQVSS